MIASMKQLICCRCGAPLPADTAPGVVTCPFCGCAQAPVPETVVERVIERVVVIRFNSDS
jgi:hypothetical protein